MEEKNPSVKRRERIKTILIIFLAILLLLTFFSNTIMNHSLPTVSAQYAGYGQINEKVRGSGIVNANQNYEVKAEGNRTVASVGVKVGDEVKTGDTLFVLESSGDDEAYKTAQQELEAAELAYQKALLTAAPDYAEKNQEIAEAREDLQTATRKLADARRQSGTGISESAYRQASKKVTDATEKLTTLRTYLSSAEEGNTAEIPASYLSGITAAKTAFDAASADREAAQAQLDARTAAVTVSSAEQQATVTALERAAVTAETTAERAKADYDASGGDLALKRAMEDAQSAAKYAREDAEAARSQLADIQTKEQAVRDAQNALDQANAALESARSAMNDALGSVTGAIQQEINSVQRELDDASATVSAYETQGEAQDISLLEADVTTKERTLQSLIMTLAKTKKDDALAAQIADLDLESQRKSLEQQREAVDKLKKDSGTVNVTSKNDGVVSAVNYAAGDEVMDGSSLCTIMLTGAGYTLQFTVTAEQSRRVKPGVKAEITNNYYSDITATLLTNKADTTNPSGTDRVLTFEITGSDVTPGQMLALSIPCSSQNYDCVVPSSAIQEDNDGKFVLVVQTKSTPLGNRYYASRADVTVLASDEVNSAVQGDINYSDFVITTAEKPIKPGNQVRMEE